MRYIISSILLVIASSSCNKYGELSAGKADSMLITCSSMVGSLHYKVANNKVWADTSNTWFTEKKNYTLLLSNEKFIIAEALMTNIPSKLYSSKSRIYNDERYVDCEAYNVTIYQNGEKYNWSLSGCLESPKYAVEYSERIQKAIDLFQQP